MYVHPNFKSKKDLKLAVAMGCSISVYQPNADVTGFAEPKNGSVALEGPHYPQPHRWYATAVLQDGKIVSIK